MKDKKILKKWWFWLIVAVVVLGAIGSLGQGGDNNLTSTTSNTQDATNSESSSTGTLPKLNTDDYKGNEGLIVYKELKGNGYTVSAEFEKQALTDMNGKASDVFEPLDQNKSDDRLSVDAFVVGSLIQDGDSVKLTIVLSPKN